MVLHFWSRWSSGISQYPPGAEPSGKPAKPSLQVGDIVDGQTQKLVLQRAVALGTHHCQLTLEQMDSLRVVQLKNSQQRNQKSLYWTGSTFQT